MGGFSCDMSFPQQKWLRKRFVNLIIRLWRVSLFFKSLHFTAAGHWKLFRLELTFFYTVAVLLLRSAVCCEYFKFYSNCKLMHCSFAVSISDFTPTQFRFAASFSRFLLRSAVLLLNSAAVPFCCEFFRFYSYTVPFCSCAVPFCCEYFKFYFYSSVLLRAFQGYFYTVQFCSYAVQFWCEFQVLVCRFVVSISSFTPTQFRFAASFQGLPLHSAGFTPTQCRFAVSISSLTPPVLAASFFSF
jgi:hypothetical protein